MKTKYIVGIVLAVFVVFMSGVFAWGFFASQSANKPTTTEPAAPAPAEETPTSATPVPAGYTASQVAQHNAASDCWVIIAGQVYNVTPFLNQHPGGASAITPYCGRDASQPFATQGRTGGSHPASAAEILKQYLVGPLQ